MTVTANFYYLESSELKPLVDELQHLAKPGKKKVLFGLWESELPPDTEGMDKLLRSKLQPHQPFQHSGRPVLHLMSEIPQLDDPAYKLGAAIQEVMFEDWLSFDPASAQQASAALHQFAQSDESINALAAEHHDEIDIEDEPESPEVYLETATYIQEWLAGISAERIGMMTIG